MVVFHGDISLFYCLILKREPNGRDNKIQELCESQSGCPGLPVPNNPYGLCGIKAIFEEEEEETTELRSCVKDEVNVLGSLSLIVRMVSVDVNQQ